MMRAFSAAQFTLPLPPTHRFPMAKYAALHDRVASAADIRVHHAPRATRAALERAHHPDYVARALGGTLHAAEVRRIGFPNSPALIERARRSVGATVAAASHALRDGAAANLAGGTHHAGPGLSHAHADAPVGSQVAHGGAGYCVFNDIAVAAFALFARGAVQRVLVLDLDVHHGNGTALIAAEHPWFFTLSVHGAENYPAKKPASTWDIGLPTGTTDDAYLGALAPAVRHALKAAAPDLVFYLAGADVIAADALGKLALSKAGAAARDAVVFDACAAHRVPVAVCMGGGYAPNVADIVDVHHASIRAAATYAHAWRG